MASVASSAAIALGGTRAGGDAVALLDSFGNIDLSFSGDGFASYSFPNGEARGSDVAFDGSGRLLISGVTRTSGDPTLDDGSATLWRFLADGDLDTGFATGGTELFDRRLTDNVITAAADLEPAAGGEFYAVGAAVDLATGESDLTLWRLQP